MFDLDDTLFQEIDFVRSGFSAVADAVQRRYDFDCGKLLSEHLETRRLGGAFQAVATAGGLPPDSLPVMLEIYRVHEPVLSLQPAVREALTALKLMDGVVGCITDGRSSTQRNKIAALGLADVLDPVMISEETGYGKPDPHNFQEIMHLVDARHFWYIADNPRKDFIAPNALGWTTVGVEASDGIYSHAGADISPEHLPQHELALSEALRHLTGHERAF